MPIGTTFALHQQAEEFLEARYPMARVLTAWPASDELTRPYLGYVTRPMQVVRIENFAVEQLLSAADLHSAEPARILKWLSSSRRSMSPRIRCWSIGAGGRNGRRDFSTIIAICLPAAAAQILGGSLVYSETRNGQWVGVIEMEQRSSTRETR